VLAKGNPAPTEKSRFKWCQDKLKAMPADKVIQALLRDDIKPLDWKYDGPIVFVTSDGIINHKETQKSHLCNR
jgi:hypothetical protein